MAPARARRPASLLALAFLLLSPGDPAASKQQSAAIGRWDVTWTRPESWQPRRFTGVLDIRDGEAGASAKVLFREITPRSFRPGAATFDGDSAAISFPFGQPKDGLMMRLTADGDSLRGEATMPGRIDWSPFEGTRVAPPADLPGRALMPYEVGSTPSANGLRSQDAWEIPAGPVPWLSADGSRIWSVQRSALLTGTLDRPDELVVVSRRAPSWIGDAPNGVFVAYANGEVGNLSADGTYAALGALEGKLRWVHPLENALLVAVQPDQGGLRVVEVGFDGAQTERFSHPTADDVVFDSELAPRFLLLRTRQHFGRGVHADVVQVVGPDGAPWGQAFRQVPWAENDPVPRVGEGPVRLLGGGDLSGLGTVGKTGFEPPAETLDGQWADATHLLVDPDDGNVDAVGWTAERVHWQALDPDGEELGWLAEQLGADVQVLQRVAGDRRWVIQARSGSTPARSWIFDRDTRELLPFGPEPPVKLQPVDPLVLKADDGLPLAAYLTRPAGEPPWPTVVVVHGGPWAGRHRWTPDAQAQQWAERGYATLAVNFRGTHGFGWELTHGPQGDFGREMIDDVDDAIAWAIDQGYADPDRIAMVGSSYGGYAALAFATAEKPRLRCAVGGLVRGNLTVPGGGLNIYSVGDAAWRAEHSADQHTERITGPILVWNGGKDGENADTIASFVERSEKNDKDVAWVRFPWEGHGIEDPAGQRALAVIQDRFLGACLGGPSWDWPEDFALADLEVRAGVELVPGLSERVR